jgi:hypothetical protein
MLVGDKIIQKFEYMRSALSFFFCMHHDKAQGKTLECTS